MSIKDDIASKVKSILDKRFEFEVTSKVPDITDSRLTFGNKGLKFEVM